MYQSAFSPTAQSSPRKLIRQGATLPAKAVLFQRLSKRVTCIYAPLRKTHLPAAHGLGAGTFFYGSPFRSATADPSMAHVLIAGWNATISSERSQISCKGLGLQTNADWIGVAKNWHDGDGSLLKDWFWLSIGCKRLFAA